MSLKKKFGQRIKALRKACNMTQEQLAEKLNIETPNLSRMENGVHFPQTSKIEQLSKIFDVPVCELFNFGYLQDKTDLILRINNFMQNASQKDLEFLYKIVKNIQEYK